MMTHKASLSSCLEEEEEEEEEGICAYDPIEPCQYRDNPVPPAKQMNED